jgi:hypothetical protein
MKPADTVGLTIYYTLLHSTLSRILTALGFISIVWAFFYLNDGGNAYTEDEKHVFYENCQGNGGVPEVMGGRFLNLPDYLLCTWNDPEAHFGISTHDIHPLRLKKDQVETTALWVTSEDHAVLFAQACLHLDGTYATLDSKLYCEVDNQILDRLDLNSAFSR